LTVYRICKAKYPANDGEGARRAGGRWNHKGTAILYCGATASLCALEVLAHSSMLPADMIVVQARVPNSLPIQTVEESDLPPGWSSPIPSKKTQDLGTDWVRSGATAVLSVPSVIIPSERNFLLNPAHPDFARIRFFPPRPFTFDTRLRPAQ
jgi:RES domain-containing protein